MERQALRWAGLVLFAGTGLFYAASGLVAPPWGVALLWAIWIGFLGLVIRWWRRSPRRVVAVPFAAAAAWLAVVSLGGALFDWSA